jgi:hypothetical protein
MGVASAILVILITILCTSLTYRLAPLLACAHLLRHDCYVENLWMLPYARLILEYG